MVISAFECLKRADISINRLIHAYDAKPAFFVSINARRSLKDFHNKYIPGTGDVVASLKAFREAIEEYVCELSKYY